MDPFDAFTSYPTERLSASSNVALADVSVDAAMARFRGMAELSMVGYAHAVLPSQPELEAMIAACAACAAGPVAASDVVAAMPPERRAYGLRAIVWLAKIGVVRAAR